jgi:biofilm PGA synthesis protein PgaD
MTPPARKEPQIQAPELLSGPERTRDTVFTALMWVVYMYLWAPLISLLAWLLGFELAYEVMIRTGGANGLGDVLLNYGIAIVSIFVIITVWSMGNKLRYGKLMRRRSVNEITLAPMAEYFGVDVASAARLRSMKLVEIRFDEAGRPQIATHLPAGPAAALDGGKRRGSGNANTATSAQ